MFLNIERSWLFGGINIWLGVIALVCLIVSGVYIWKNYSLRNVINRYRRKVREENEKRQAETQLQETSYSAMARHILPVELFDLLGVKTEEDLSLERQRRVKTANLSVNSNDFSDIVHSMNPEAVFSFINRFLEKSVPAIYEAGGVVEGFKEAGMTALFLKNPEKALETAVTLCEQLNELGARYPKYTEFSIGITYENAIIGVVGAPQRKGILLMSEDSSGLSAWLQGLAVKYYARIVVTEMYASLVEKFQKRFNVRLLGYVYVSDTDTVKKIYDVFDGDETEVKNRKRQTKMLFEKGVALFMEREFMQARQYFIEVLKTDRFDRAAKEYVFRCELYNNNPEEEQTLFLERYG